MLNVQHNAQQLVDALGELAFEQLPFATAVALTKAARDGKDSARRELRRRFQLRNRYTERGILSTRADKVDWPDVTATVYVDESRRYIAGHEEGETRTGTAGHRIAIPTRAIKRTKGGKVTPTSRPGRLLEAGKAYKAGQEILRAKVSKRAPLRRLYLLRERVRIEAQPFFREPVTETVDRRLPRHMLRELDAAVRSRRVRAGSFTSEQGRFFYLKALRHRSRRGRA